MPSFRTSAHHTVKPTRCQQMTIFASIVLNFMERRTKPGLLYSENELHEILEQCHASDTLEKNNFPRLNRARYERTGSLNHTLGILWENGYIRKFATGRFSLAVGGRPVGVVWEIKPKTRRPSTTP